MENFATLVIPVFFLFFLLRLIVLPLKWGTKIFLNSACGFLCLWVLNSVAGFTGLLFPVNYATVLVTGFLGLPGIGVLTLVQLFL